MTATEGRYSKVTGIEGGVQECLWLWRLLQLKGGLGVDQTDICVCLPSDGSSISNPLSYVNSQNG